MYLYDPNYVVYNINNLLLGGKTWGDFCPSASV